MVRKIYEVYAKIVDANGNYSTLNGYPKVFDSRHYDNDYEKTLKRATGEFHKTFGAMCDRDDRQLQTVFLIAADGAVIESKHVGEVADLPDPEPETEEET